MQRVFVDANILMSGTLRGWLYNLALQPDNLMFTLYSSEDVIVEALYHLRRMHPQIPSVVIDLWKKQMKQTVELVNAYDPGRYADDYLGADPNDLHVHAAAISAQCDYLLTNDRKLYKGLTSEQLDQLEYEVIGADDFFCLVADSSPVIMDVALGQQMKYSGDKKRTLEEQLRACDCVRFALRVKRALMRKAGVSISKIEEMCPLPADEAFSGSAEYLAQISGH